MLVIFVRFRHIVEKNYSRSKYEKPLFPILFQSGICPVGSVEILGAIPLKLELWQMHLANKKLINVRAKSEPTTTCIK